MKYFDGIAACQCCWPFPEVYPEHCSDRYCKEDGSGENEIRYYLSCPICRAQSATYSAVADAILCWNDIMQERAAKIEELYGKI